MLGLVGSTVDQVRFDACVDAGGFGLIYRGYHQGLGETVAIKCLRIASIQKTNEAIREALAGRFRDETKLLYRLSQGNLDIVRCMSSGTLIAPKTKEYTPYMILEWLEGSTLSLELKERRAKQLRPRTLEAAVQLLDPAAGGLAYAHAHDVVHRDVKPGNLFLARTREGVRMKVLDFGLAKILSDESIGVRPSVETGVGVHFCSPSYGAPEQFTGQVGKIGPWTDVYSLTLVLLEVLTGDKVRPAGNLAEGLLKAIDKKAGSPSASSLGLHLAPAVEDLLLRAVSQNPLERPRDVGVFWSALKEAVLASPKQAPQAAAATVMDDSMGEAMQAVRNAVVKQSAQPSPFAGTMVMQNAPGGAPHLSALGHGPMHGQPSMQHPHSMQQPSMQQPQPSMQQPGGPPAPVAVSRSTAPLKMTMPIGSKSPLASSMQQAMGPGSVAPPPHREPQGGTHVLAPPGSMMPPQSMPPPGPLPGPQSLAPPGYGGPQGPSPPRGSYPPGPGRRDPNRTTDPRAGSSLARENATNSGISGHSSLEAAGVPKKGIGVIVFIMMSLALAAIGFSYWWFRMRGH